jgi:ABC-type transporter Mla subunit MlaD
MDILDKSSHQLGELKTHVTNLVKFFNDVLKDVEHTVNTDIENFLRPIKNGIEESSTDAKEVEQIRLGKASKKVSFCFKLEFP